MKEQQRNRPDSHTVESKTHSAGCKYIEAAMCGLIDIMFPRFIFLLHVEGC